MYILKFKPFFSFSPDLSLSPSLLSFSLPLSSSLITVALLFFLLTVLTGVSSSTSDLVGFLGLLCFCGDFTLFSFEESSSDPSVLLRCFFVDLIKHKTDLKKHNYIKLTCL